jgi:hypothetical protein
MKFFKGVRLSETLLAALTLLMLLVPAYAQQEMDPTWYDPWAKPSPAVAANAKPHKVRPANSRLKSSRVLDARKREAAKSAPLAAMQPVKSAALRP